ncbi:hypothetical protein [Corallococcus sp. 4LFB]|uniref:hypothetical protein n=1 Tax=Corallococcus sp. 4LFB TaxID=3383249 RepID=UPI0039750806
MGRTKPAISGVLRPRKNTIAGLNHCFVSKAPSAVANSSTGLSGTWPYKPALKPGCETPTFTGSMFARFCACTERGEQVPSSRRTACTVFSTQSSGRAR